MRRLALLSVIAAAASLPAACGSLPDNTALRARTMENVHTIQVALEAWSADHHHRYPAPGRVTAGDFGTVAALDDGWPANPWTGKPMAQGTSPGDFSYVRSPDADGAVLTGFGVDGPLISVELGP